MVRLVIHTLFMPQSTHDPTSRPPTRPRTQAGTSEIKAASFRRRPRLHAITPDIRVPKPVRLPLRRPCALAPRPAVREVAPEPAQHQLAEPAVPVGPGGELAAQGVVGLLAARVVQLAH